MMQESFKRRQTVVKTIDFDKLRQMGSKNIGIGDVGNSLLNNVMGRLGLNTRVIIQQPKEYKLNRKNHVLKDLFKSKGSKSSKADETQSKSDVIRTKLAKGNLRAAISRRYKGAIAEKVVARFTEFANAQDFESYVDLIEKLLNFETERLMRIAFEVYDFNQDKQICELDMYANIQG